MTTPAWKTTAGTGPASRTSPTAVLDRMCGPLCDAVLDRSRSARLLEELESANLLLVPLDRRREWYRYHTLFGELLRAELERREQGTIAGLQPLGDAAPDALAAAGDQHHAAGGGRGGLRRRFVVGHEVNLSSPRPRLPRSVGLPLARRDERRRVAS